MHFVINALRELFNLQGENIFMAAKREVEEETGVSVEYISINVVSTF